MGDTVGLATEIRSGAMIGRPSRRRFLQTLSASGVLIAAPSALGQNAWNIQA